MAVDAEGTTLGRGDTTAWFHENARIYLFVRSGSGR